VDPQLKHIATFFFFLPGTIGSGAVCVDDMDFGATDGIMDAEANAGAVIRLFGQYCRV
jgi:hypothetical protein